MCTFIGCLIFVNILFISVSLSYGRDTLTPQDWEDAKRMEKDRKERVASLPARPGAHMANGMNVNLHPQGDQ